MNFNKEQIENKLQFVITILLFFFALFPETQQAGAILVAIYVIDYLVFTANQHKINSYGLRIINILLMFGIGSFLLPLITVAFSTTEKVIPVWQGYSLLGLLSISMVLLIFIPVIILGSLIVMLNFKKFRK